MSAITSKTYKMLAYLKLFPNITEAPFEERLQVAQQLLTTVPLIDGHNDLPWNIRKFVHNQLNEFQ